MRTIWILLFSAFIVYSALVYASGDPAGGEGPDEHAQQGMRLWREQNCQSCHQLYGLGGYMGPDLTNAMSVRDTSRLRTFIRYGTGRMPAHPLTDEEINDLIAFLAWVDRSGSNKVPKEAIHWTGTYIIPQR